jgi:hypothetical protein
MIYRILFCLLVICLNSCNTKNEQCIREDLFFCDNLEQAFENPSCVKVLEVTIHNENDFKNGFSEFENNMDITLNLSFNSDLMFKHLLEKLSTIDSIESLTIFNSFFEDIPNEIGNLKINKLNLYFDKIKKVPISITQLSELQELSIYSDSISLIPKELINLKNITRIKIINLRQDSIPNPIFSLKQLEYLNLGNRITNISDKIYSLKKLKEFVLIDTPFSISEQNFHQKNKKYNKLEILKSKLPDCKFILNQDLLYYNSK